MTLAKQIGWQAIVLAFALGPFTLPASAQQASATDQQEPLTSRVAQPKSQDPRDPTSRSGADPPRFAARLAERSLREFDANITDYRLHIPIRFASYSWPEKPGESAPLEESYTYLKLKINNRFTDRDFDKDNPAIFKDD